MSKSRFLVALLLSASLVAFAPSASASPPTCSGDFGDHALASYPSCVAACLESSNWGRGWCPDPSFTEP